MMNSALMQFTPHMPSLGSLLIVAFIGLLVFGKRLPEVGRSLGKGITEFKKGLAGIEDDEQPAKESRADRSLPRSSTSSAGSLPASASDADASRQTVDAAQRERQ